MAVHAVNMYIAANLLLVLAAVGAACLRAVNARAATALSYRRQLQIAYALTMAALVLPCISLLPQPPQALPTNAQIWSGASMGDAAHISDDTHRIGIAVASSEVSAPLRSVRAIAASLFLAGVAVFVSLLLGDALRIRRILVNAQTIAARRRVRVLCSQAISVPFSLWVPGLHFIVLPADLILRPVDLRIALRHEAQHHRQLDTRVTYALQLLRLLFFWNPAVHSLHRSIVELQEFACDEALIATRAVSPHAYCSCLLRVAESMAEQRTASIGVGMMGTGAGSTLRRRIEAILSARSLTHRRRVAAALGGALLVVMAGIAVAFPSTIQDRRVSLEQAQRMLAVARRDSDFPLVVNERVLAQLNRLLATPDGREFVRASLQRMQEHEALVMAALDRHGLPTELMAVPLVESGYRNLPPSGDSRQGAGLWMFIEPTGRRFGLAIDGSVDERLNVELETDAAMRMLGGLHRQLDDWALALLAFNTGERVVAEAMRTTGSRNAWRAVEQGFENDAGYLPSVMAMALIMQNPSALE